MVAVIGGGSLWFLLLLGFVFPASLVNAECLVDECCCYSDNYNASYQAEIDAFSNPPTPPSYEYTGIIPKGSDVFEPCLCSDVTVVVTDITLTDAAYVTKANDVSQLTTLQTEVNTKLNDLKGTMTTTETSLEPILLSLTATYKSHTSDDVTFKVEVLLRGRSEAVKTPVSNALAAGLAGNTLGPVDTTSMVATVLSCSSEPPAALGNGTRSVIASYVASSQLVYTCNDKFRLSSGNDEEISTCSPVDTQWTPLPDGLECEISHSKCSEDPPTPPPLTTSTWNNYSKTEGTVVNYLCVDGYSSEDDLIAESECNDGSWSVIDTAFKCFQTGCLESPPQVPTQGVLNWNELRANGTKMTYTCREGFKSNTGEDPVVSCTNMTWIGYPENWACVDEKLKLNLKGALDGETDEEVNLFLVVTIPSVAGLIVFIICCLCCTRVDSPLFNICNARGPISKGYSNA